MRTGFGEEGHEPMFRASGPGPHGPSRNDRLTVETTACFGSDFAFGSGDYEIATRAAKFYADNREAESIKSTMETTTAWMTKARRDDMIDTGFHVPETKLTRLVAPPPGGRLAVWDVTKAPALFSGGGGLVSTVRDYLQFCRMLLKNGELNGVRILSPQTVKRMTANALPAESASPIK
jgi:hypothetical protein